MAVPMFELLTGAELLERRDYSIADTTLLDPMSTNPIIEGEWLELNASKQLIRTGPNNANLEAGGMLTNPFSGQYWGERGRYDVRAINKLPILLWGNYEAFTKVFWKPGMPDANTPQTLGQKLGVASVPIGGQFKKGLYVPTSNGHHWIVGYFFGAGRTSDEIRFMRREPIDIVIP